jgi:hypothetical protein
MTRSMLSLLSLLLLLILLLLLLLLMLLMLLLLLLMMITEKNDDAPMLPSKGRAAAHHSLFAGVRLYTFA